jgi:5'/3'-nucleotidase
LRILVTNDDGILSPGLVVLVQYLTSLGQVTVVAPDRDRSAVGHSLTLHSPLRADETRPGFFAVDGTPTDCIHLGIHGILGECPDLVVSGINKGGNLGDDITYSGTVSAAMEATLMGVPAMAVSLVSNSFREEDFVGAAAFATRLALVLVKNKLPPDTFFNVNVPVGVPKGVRMTRQGKRIYEGVVTEKKDPRGRKYYWIGGGELGFHNIEGTDFHAIHAGYSSITPLHLDLTNYHSFKELSGWKLENVLAGDAFGETR